MNTKRSSKTSELIPIWLAFCIGCLLATGAAWAQTDPSSDLLLPPFEVDLEGAGLTTLFAVVNSSSDPVSTQIRVCTDWGIPILEFDLPLKPRRT